MSAAFAPAAWAVVRITGGRREVLGIASTAAEARRIAEDREDVLVLFRAERRPPRCLDGEF